MTQTLLTRYIAGFHIGINKKDLIEKLMYKMCEQSDRELAFLLLYSTRYLYRSSDIKSRD